MIGIDIIEINRVKELVEQPNFLNRVFVPEEQAYIAAATDKTCAVAGMFAIKESVSKALGTGIANGVSWHDIVVSHSAYGQPTVCLNNGAVTRLKTLNRVQVVVSLSHDCGLAVAVAVLV